MAAGRKRQRAKQAGGLTKRKHARRLAAATWRRHRQALASRQCSQAAVQCSAVQSRQAGRQAGRSARTCVAIKEARARPPLQHRCKLPGEVVCIAHPGVHAESTCAVQHMPHLLLNTEETPGA
jgi:hypothetical protein